MIRIELSEQTARALVALIGKSKPGLWTWNSEFERILLEPALDALENELKSKPPAPETWIDAVEDPGEEIGRRNGQPSPESPAEIETPPPLDVVIVPQDEPDRPLGGSTEAPPSTAGATAAEPSGNPAPAGTPPPGSSPGEANIARIEGKGWRAKYTPQDMVQVVRALAENPTMALTQMVDELRIPFVGCTQAQDLSDRWSDLIAELRTCSLQRKNELLAQLLRSTIVRAKRVGAAVAEED